MRDESKNGGEMRELLGVLTGGLRETSNNNGGSGDNKRNMLAGNFNSN